MAMEKTHEEGRMWRRSKSTRRGVVLGDAIARMVITAGGVGTILAVLGVCLFLVWVALPLFTTARISEGDGLEPAWLAESPLAYAVDEYRVMGWVLRPDGVLQSFSLKTGAVLEEVDLGRERVVTCVSFPTAGEEGVLGFSDGLVQRVKIGFKTAFIDDEDVPESVREELGRLPFGAGVAWGKSVVQRTPEAQYRRQQVYVRLLETAQVAETPVRAVTHIVRPDGLLVCALTGSGEAFALKAVVGREKESFLTGATTFSFGSPVVLPLAADNGAAPVFLRLSARGRDLYAVWENGLLVRVRCADPANAFVAEKGRLLSGEGCITAFRFILGDNTLVWGDSNGATRGGFLVRLSEGASGEGLRDVQLDPRAQFRLAISKSLSRKGPAVTALAPSTRSRLLLAGHEDGSLRLYNVTSETLLARHQLPDESAVVGIAVAPKEDGSVAFTKNRFSHADMDPMYPEASLAALFRPVWYEGYPVPMHTWQSSSATDDFEAKYGLMPLIFGTIKATFYSMLFGAPLALLAAIFSSEFLRPRVKAAVKPTVELMASLPSVVLGFLAALVFAPFVEQVVPATLTLFIMLPLTLLVFAYLWQLLPPRISLPLADWRFPLMAVPILVGLLLAAYLGPVVERVLFAGDLKGWLAWEKGRSEAGDLRFGGATGGWMILCLPLSALATTFLMNRLANPRMRALSRRMERHGLAVLDLARFAVACVATLGVAWAVAGLLSSAGWDPRGGFLDTYVQRNSLVVGIVMGFAIVPIIYTISDDALSTVPDHLRGASLGAGATKWQTAVRVVIPTAMSGLFSAMMVGLGRAVGETMIVLMAAGNTPIMSWNIFEGFRTLSANIAVELPEAVKDSTHYRTLFLAALVLLLMTFLVNTVAEMVRLRFRKRAASL